MSRCFPFPPPGYEKKDRTDDVDLLNKDKHKEKKHKKEKKDKKKEGKDKEKERSKDKDRDKKDRKEKHKDKKKSKDKKKTDEEKIEEQAEGSNAGGNRGKHPENNQEAEAIEEKRLAEISRTLADEERGRRDQMVEIRPASEPRKEDGADRFGEKYSENRTQEKQNSKDRDGHYTKTDRQRFKDEGRVFGNTVVPGITGMEQRRDQMFEKLPVKENFVARLVEKHDDNRVLGNTLVPSITLSGQRRDQMVENLPASDPRKDGIPRFGEKHYDNRIPERENTKDKNGHDTKTEGQRSKDVGRVIGNTVRPPNFSGLEQRRVGLAAQTEKDAERKVEGKEKSKDREGNGKQEKHKNKHRDGEKRSKEKKVKEKDRTKEKVKKEKSRKHDKIIEVPKDPINTLNIKPTQIPTDSGASGSTEENPRKRKDSETNGFLHDNDAPPSKFAKSCHPPIVNGRKSELPGQPATSQFPSAFHTGAKNIMWDDKVLKANGLIPAAQPTPSVPPPRVQSRENGEASKKKPPPHPDSKYLDKILSVPKMDDCADFDDQEWLFSSDSLKKPKTVSSGVDGSPQVWDRALRIDYADVCALPYVIPY